MNAKQKQLNFINQLLSIFSTELVVNEQLQAARMVARRINPDMSMIALNKEVNGCKAFVKSYLFTNVATFVAESSDQTADRLFFRLTRLMLEQ